MSEMWMAKEEERGGEKKVEKEGWAEEVLCRSLSVNVLSGWSRKEEGEERCGVGGVWCRYRMQERRAAQRSARREARCQVPGAPCAMRPEATRVEGGINDDRRPLARSPTRTPRTER